MLQFLIIHFKSSIISSPSISLPSVSSSSISSPFGAKICYLGVEAVWVFASAYLTYRRTVGKKYDTSEEIFDKAILGLSTIATLCTPAEFIVLCVQFI